MRISDWSSDVCSSDLRDRGRHPGPAAAGELLQAARRGRRRSRQAGHAAGAEGRRQGAGQGAQQAPGRQIWPPLMAIWERLQPRAFAPYPAKAGEGWGGVPLASPRTDTTLSQPPPAFAGGGARSEEHTSELQSLMRISYAVFCLKKKNNTH